VRKHAFQGSAAAPSEAGRIESKATSSIANSFNYVSTPCSNNANSFNYVSTILRYSRLAVKKS
jgi:hypothetical protein